MSLFADLSFAASHRAGVALPRGNAGYAQPSRRRMRRRAEGRSVRPVYNSAYYEHSFLADEMGIELVEGAAFLVDGNRRLLRFTTEGPSASM